MENLKLKQSKSCNSSCSTRIYSGENDELICIKTYQGDWGDWDEKPVNTLFNTDENPGSITDETQL